MATVSDVLKIAAKEVGVKENPSGSNNVKYNTWYYGREVSGSSYPWCAAFVSWVLAQAGAASLVVKSASCPTIKSDAQKRGTYHSGSSGIKAGDIVLYQFDSDADPDHIGIVESVSGSSIVAIEGNTSVTSQDNGGAVMRRPRYSSQIMGYVRPKYDGAAANPPASKTATTTATAAHTIGYSAESFIRDVQRAIGANVDGIVGTETRGKLPELSKTKNEKHSVVASVQVRLFALGYDVGKSGADGVFGADTETAVKAFQKVRNISADGVVGKNTWDKLFS